MNVLRSIVLLLAFVVVTSSAQESNTPPTKITIDGVTYENVRWGTVTPSTIAIFHKTGAATISLAKLPPDLQKEFGYDPKRAMQFEAANLERATFIAETRNKVVLDGQVVVTATLSNVTLSGTLKAKGELENPGYTGYVVGSLLSVNFPVLVGTRPGHAIASDAVRYHGANGPSFYLPARPVYKPNMEDVLILDWICPKNIGETIEVQACPVNPNLGVRTYAVPQPITFEFWKNNRKLFHANR